MSKIEILAPVGNEEMLRAAVFSGADAVYLGFSGFNARTSANNFNADTLKDAVAFCHARGVAVHVALNTTVYGGELPALEQAIRAVAASGADAVICQDLAVATLIGKIAPQLPRHGSTQMSVHSLQGALELKELGFTRVVLARELSMPEVEHITKHCGIETECFVHGALCMCVSGQCYMSAFLGGRSGNRGSCAGPCRLPFEANALPEGKPGRLHHLSLKDNSVIDKLDKLQALGVASAKIEGRLRTPEYVAAAVSACLAGREGRAYDRDLLKNAFSRSGFTSGYLDGKIDGTMFGVRSEADAEQTKKTLPMLRELYRRERSRVPVKMKLEIEEGGEKLTVTDADGSKAFAYGDAEPQPARTDPTASLHRSLAKTGGTPFAVEDQDITVEMDGNYKENRNLLYRTFPIKRTGTMQYIEDGEAKAIEYEVESVIPGATTGVVRDYTISLKCTDPYFKDLADIEVVMASWVSDFYFPACFPEEGRIFGHREADLVKEIENESGADNIGIVVIFRADGAVKNPAIYHTESGEFTKVGYLDNDFIMSSGQYVIINTYTGKKNAYLLDGVTQAEIEFQSTPPVWAETF